MGKKNEIQVLNRLVELQDREIDRLSGALGMMERGEEMKPGQAGYAERLFSQYSAPAIHVSRNTSWSDATIDTVKEMLDQHYAGKLSIYDYWGIGDERIVQLGGEIGQTVQFVLTDKQTNVLAERMYGQNIKCAFSVDQKNCLKGVSRPMNEECTNEGGWVESEMRAWVDKAYTDAIPPAYLDAFKKFITEDGVIDRFALRSEMELFGEVIYGSEGMGGRQVEYYKKTRNRIKLDGDDEAEARWYWERSPYSGSSDIFCVVYSNGGATNDYASDAYGLAPFGCI